MLAFHPNERVWKTKKEPYPATKVILRRWLLVRNHSNHDKYAGGGQERHILAGHGHRGDQTLRRGNGSINWDTACCERNYCLV